MNSHCGNELIRWLVQGQARFMDFVTLLPLGPRPDRRTAQAAKAQRAGFGKHQGRGETAMGEVQSRRAGAKTADVYGGQGKAGGGCEGEVEEGGQGGGESETLNGAPSGRSLMNADPIKEWPPSGVGVGKCRCAKLPRDVGGHRQECGLRG